MATVSLSLPRMNLGFYIAIERHRYKVTQCLIGLAQTYNQPCLVCVKFNMLTEFEYILLETDVYDTKMNGNSIIHAVRIISR